MKSLFILIISFAFFSCKNASPVKSEEDSSMIFNEEMDKISGEIMKFEKLLVTYYEESKKSPELIILKADSLLLAYGKEKNKSQIKSIIESDLHYLKAELYYRLGEYEESISELKLDNCSYNDRAVAVAANYVKLKEFNKAKSYIDSIGKGLYIYDYAFANYNESIGNRDEAFNIYREIKNDKSIKHYAYYKLAVYRYEELKNENPKLLNEIYFPTGNPSFDIADSDNENRTKIFNLMEKLLEDQNLTETSIVESPQENDKNYYWVRVETEQNEKYNFYVYQETFEIRFLDTINNKLMTLEEWRKQK